MKQVFAFLVLLGLSSPVLASFGEHLVSVHFNGQHPDFGTVPRRGLVWMGETDDRKKTTGWGGGYIEHQELSGKRDMERQENATRLWRVVQKQAQAAGAQGNWARVRALYQGQASRFGPTGGLQDRLEILSHGSIPTGPVRAYFEALDGLEGPSTGWNASLATLSRLSADPTLPAWLREHASYQRASGYAQWLNYRKAVLLWQAQLHAFPEGEKREATLLMIGRACLLHKALPDGVATGRAAAEQLLRSFPKTRFRVAARGLLARADLEQGHYEAAAEAYCALADGDSIVWVRRRAGNPILEQRLLTLQLIAYLREFNQVTDHRRYLYSAKGISRSLDQLKPETGKRFLDRLVGDPSLAVPYFYFRLYHCDNSAKDLANLTSLADRLAQKGALPSSVRVRLSEIYYQSRAYGKAVAWSSTTTNDPDEKVRARALYVRAGCRYRHRQFDLACQDLECLLRECPKSNVRHGARELLALCAEGQGDFACAVDQFFAIQYREDYAYLIDARMPLPMLEDYWRTHSEHRDLIAYSIALRHLRLEHWDEARRWLDRVPGKSYTLFVGRTTTNRDREYRFSEEGANPKKVLANLSHLWRVAERARGAEAKAAARYAYARAYYTQGTLQLYNAPLWQGDRVWLFHNDWNTAVVTPQDNKVVQGYLYQHEVYAHTRQICLEIVKGYPRTKTAPYALYRAACAAEKLSKLNAWWWADDAGGWTDWSYPKKHVRPLHPRLDHRREGARLMAQLAKRYPNHPLAKPARKYAGVFEGSGDAAELP